MRTTDSADTRAWNTMMRWLDTASREDIRHAAGELVYRRALDAERRATGEHGRAALAVSNPSGDAGGKEMS